MLTRITLILMSFAYLTGCERGDNIPTSSEITDESKLGSKDKVLPSSEDLAIYLLNKQIEDFNSTRESNKGIPPISQRTSKISYDSAKDEITCFCQDNKPFLVLHREPDGRFKGTLRMKFHELAFSRPDGSHKWGEILADFYLDKYLF